MVNADLTGTQDLHHQLRRQDVDLLTCPDGAEALLSVGEFHPDVLVLGPEVARVDRPTLVAMVRRRYQLRVVVAGAPSSSGDVPDGAAGVLAWPPKAEDLVAVAHSRAGPEAVSSLHPEALPPDTVLRVGHIVLDVGSHRVTVAGTPVHIPLREFNLLAMLMRTPGRVLPYVVVKDTLWGSGAGDLDNTMSVHIRRLRARIGDDVHQPRLLVTVRGVGYRLDVPPGTCPARTSQS